MMNFNFVVVCLGLKQFTAFSSSEKDVWPVEAVMHNKLVASNTRYNDDGYLPLQIIISVLVCFIATIVWLMLAHFTGTEDAHCESDMNAILKDKVGNT